MSNKTKNGLVVLIVALYMLLPTDIVNDLVPLLGQVDDVAISVLGILAAMKQMPTAAAKTETTD